MEEIYKSYKKIELKRYSFLRLLAVGTFSRVFLVKEIDTNLLFCLKTLSKSEVIKDKLV